MIPQGIPIAHSVAASKYPLCHIRIARDGITSEGYDRCHVSLDDAGARCPTDCCLGVGFLSSCAVSATVVSPTITVLDN